MIFRLKKFIAKIYVAFLGRASVWILSALAKSQLSNNLIIRSIGFFPIQIADAVLGVRVLKFISHVIRREPKHKRRSHINNRKLRSFLYLAIAKADKELASKLAPEEFRKLLVNEELDPDFQYEMAHQLFQAGKLVLACETFEDLIERSSDKFSLERKLQLLRDTGITFFLLGKIEKANRFWKKAGELRRLIIGDECGPIYRILGSSWFVAIGHVAMLDFYIKYNRLYRGNQVRIVSEIDIGVVPGNYLCERFSKEGIDFLEKGQLTLDYDRWAKQNGKRSWSQLTSAERFAMVDDFWEFEFPNGDVCGYTHAADKIQKEWERQLRAPVLSVKADEQRFIDRALKQLGLPDGAWYVCLHVRESGFHKGWNTLYPSMRDSNIDDYMQAVDLIVKNGGYVIRMGDSSMKPLVPKPGVIDYAHSSLKTPRADVLIPLGSKFFLGTNSGYATIPAIFGIKCVFSNWLPIGLPLWPSQDIFSPKMFWDDERQRTLTLEEAFASNLCFIQNWSELPKGITLKDNTPEEIRELTAEALGIASDLPDRAIREARERYQKIASRYGSYAGSTLSASFIRRNHTQFNTHNAPK